MVEWLKSLPRAMFVTVVITAGILFIVLSDPPRGLCDSQLEQFKTFTKDLLSLDITKPNRTETRFRKLLDTCRSTNSPGGCYELFMQIRRTLKDTKTVSPECHGKLAGHMDFSQAFWDSVDVMVRVAWGAQPPQTAVVKSGWLDPADLNLFCELKKTANDLFGQDKWNSFAEGYFQALPGASALGRNEAWQRMLFSTNCASYL